MTHLKPKTYAGYESLIRRTVTRDVGAVSVGDLRSIEVQEWAAAFYASIIGGRSADIADRLEALHARVRDEADRADDGNGVEGARGGHDDEPVDAPGK